MTVNNSASAMVMSLREFASTRGIRLADSDRIAFEVQQLVEDRYHFTPDQMKANFDKLIQDTHDEIYVVYLRHERQYGEAVLAAFIEHLVQVGELRTLEQVGAVLETRPTSLA